jgi:uncharacterized integral membrane protein
MVILFFLALILALGLLTFAIQNKEIITLTFINWQLQEPVALVLTLAFTAGMLVGIFLITPAWWRKARAGRAQKKRIRELEHEILDVTERKLAPEHEFMEE